MSKHIVIPEEDLMWTPLLLKVALAYATSNNPREAIEPGVWDGPVVKEIQSRFQNCGFLNEKGNPTPMLFAWVRHLCNQPFPRRIEKWVVEDLNMRVDEDGTRS